MDASSKPSCPRCLLLFTSLAAGVGTVLRFWEGVPPEVLIRDKFGQWNITPKQFVLRGGTTEATTVSVWFVGSDWKMEARLGKIIFEVSVWVAVIVSRRGSF